MNYNASPYKVTKTVAGTPAEIFCDCGFIPAMVIITNRTNGAFGVYMATMADGSLNQISDGTGTSAMRTSAGVTPVAGDPETKKGFTLGTVANFNDAAAEVLDIVAFPDITA